MVRIIFSTVLVLHGLLHLIGFAKEWNIDSQGQLNGKTLINLSGSSSKVSGTFWLLACFLFLATALCYLLRREWYWIPAAAAVLISQILIIIYWQDARYGTIVNAVVLIAVVFSSAAMFFNKKATHEVNTLLNNSATNERIITEDMISNLPENVRRWMHRSNVVGRKTPNTIRLVQTGRMCTKPRGKWMSFDAVQYFSIDPPSFVWTAKIKAAPFVEIGGRDKYEQGHGNMLIKPLYIFTATNSVGKEIDQGTILRYLAEMAWFPQAAVSDYLKWEKINDRSSRVTMDYGGISASGIYFFNDDGLVSGFEAQRYGDFGGSYRKETWSISVTGYKTFNGILIGNTNEVSWKLKEGDFKWLTLEVIEVN